MNEAAIVDSLAAPPPTADGATVSAQRPFPGLRPFGFADRAFFFGRERQAFALYRLVENGRFIAVIGSSGSGKSSLVLAGLQGLLADETADESGPNWAFRAMRPGGAPIKRLAAALASLAGKDSPDDAARRRDRVEYALRQSGFSFGSALEEAGGLGGRALLLVVDQFEELFRFGLAGLALRRASVEETRARDEATQFVQILLDADRRRLKDVHVLITVRSDFIGDCAYFHGLAEAVSATQYLVPNLTRSQLEDVIRKPIEKSGAAIEPELVERLINDCSDELDQLPVLQHCLMRLWDRAGQASPERPRRLTRQTYDDVGRMAEALSRHADEILARCAGRELAVEQAFRALSELDRDGRATRRALSFDKLVAEAGVAEADLREVLNRFRAPGCSFVVPPLAAAQRLAPDDRVDVSHETLLRHWKKLAGDPGTLDTTTGRPLIGWMAEERNDGQRYRLLLSLLGDTPDDEKASLKDPLGTKRWWDSLPRTAAWGERYGGRFDAVKRLIDDNIAAQKRSRRNKILAIAGVVVSILAFFGLIAKFQIDKARDQQEAIERGAMTSAAAMLRDVLAAYGAGTLNLEGAKSLASVSEDFLRKVRNGQTTHAADPLWVDALNLESDLESNAQDHRKQLSLAEEAKTVAQPLVAANPKDQVLEQKLYDSLVRFGNALAMFPEESGRLEQALKTYQDAIAVADDLARQSATDKTEGAVSDAHLKIGDIYEIEHEPEKALVEYRKGLAVCEDAAAIFPGSVEAMRNRANANFRIAEALRQESQWDAAEDEYRLAEKDQLAILAEDPQNVTVRSNLASTYDHWGLLARSKGDLELALAKLKLGVEMQNALMRTDPSNPQWIAFAAPNYESVARTLDELKHSNEAYRYLQKAYDLRKELTILDPNNPWDQMRFAAAAKALGDRSQGVPQIEAYRDAIHAWKVVADLAQPPASIKTPSDDALAIAKALADGKDWRDAQSAYWLAKRISDMNLADDPTSAAWKAKSDSAKQSAEDAAAAATAAAAAGDAAN
jgi:tetratricopeptide (TPR) repeat protein